MVYSSSSVTSASFARSKSQVTGKELHASVQTANYYRIVLFLDEEGGKYT